MKSPPPHTIRDIGKRHWCIQICVLLGVFLATIAQASNGVKDLLTPAERLWLTKNQPRVVLAVETGYAPFVFLDANGQATGLAHDYLLLLESKLGVHFKQHYSPSLDDIFQKVRNGNVQIVNAVTKTPWRSKFLTFTDVYVSVPNVIVVSKDRPGRMREENLAGFRVSLVKSYAVTEQLTNTVPGIVPDLVPDDLTALLNVSFGRSDAAVIDLATASYLISRNGITNLRVAGEATYNIHLSMATPLGEPVLHDILQKGLATITDAERQEIHKRWISISGQSIFSDRRFWVSVGSALSVVCAALTASLIWNRTLRRQVALRTSALAKEKEALRESEAQNRALINAIPDLIFLNHRNGMYVSAHAYDPNMLYVPPETFLHRSVEEILPKLIADQFLKAFVDALEQATIRELSYCLTIDGRERCFEARVAPCTEDTVITIVRDVTERKRLQDQLLQAQKMESIGVLAGGIIHDFNNILTVILGCTDELQVSVALHDERSHANIETIQSAARQAAEFSRALLSFSRKQEMNFQPVALNDVITDTRKLLLRMVPKNIHFTLDLSGDTLTVMADSGQLRQVLINLAINARDSMTDGGQIQISTWLENLDEEAARKHGCEVSGDYAVVSVSDTGKGMDEQTMDKIFEPFFTTKEIGKGTGLGLSIVSGIIKQHKGWIQVDSKPGAGTVFRIYLPRVKAEIPRVTHGEPTAPAEGSGTILVAEDEALVQFFVKKALTKAGYRLILAEDGEEALRKFKENQDTISLVITDVSMPKMDGQTLCEEMCKINPRIKVIFLSGYTEEMIACKGISASQMRFITKPFSKEALLHEIQSILVGS
ncbi:MAG: transporter substrate-binding domain-containing protein [Desulfuromonadales bacterium]|nr:transporter substrate-binding domain-containing protein [Desulfuromonadales bacterium]